MKDNRSRVGEFYDALSQSYDQLYGSEQSIKHENVMSEISNERFPLLIDIGCGTGTLLERAVDKYDLALGTDVSRAMMEKARERNEKRKTGFIRAVSSALPFRSEISDCVLSISVIEWNENGKISELRRICKPSGILLVSLFHAGLGGERLRRLMPHSRRIQLSSRESLLVTGQRTG